MLDALPDDQVTVSKHQRANWVIQNVKNFLMKLTVIIPAGISYRDRLLHYANRELTVTDQLVQNTDSSCTDTWQSGPECSWCKHKPLR